MTENEFLEFAQEVWLGLRELQNEKFTGQHHVEDLAYSYVRAVEAVQVVLDVLQFRLKNQPVIGPDIVAAANRATA